MSIAKAILPTGRASGCPTKAKVRRQLQLPPNLYYVFRFWCSFTSASSVLGRSQPDVCRRTYERPRASVPKQPQN